MEVDVRTPELVAVGFDGSESCRAALAWAAEEARDQHKHLYVFHCWHLPALVTAAMPGAFPPPDVHREARDNASAALDDAIEWLRGRFPTVPMAGAALEGPAGPRLVAHVRHGDLLVLGMNSRHRLAARMLGSTVEHVLRHGRGTVVVVPLDGRPSSTGPFSRHVVAAVGDAVAASSVLGVAFAEAATHRWPLVVVHADRHHHEPIEVAGADAALAARPIDQSPLRSVIESWHARYPQVVVRKAAFDGPPQVVLEHACAGAQLLVIGRSTHQMRPVRLVDQLLARVSCPVAVTPAMLAEAVTDAARVTTAATAASTASLVPVFG